MEALGPPLIYGLLVMLTVTKLFSRSRRRYSSYSDDVLVITVVLLFSVQASPATNRVTKAAQELAAVRYPAGPPSVNTVIAVPSEPFRGYLVESTCDVATVHPDTGGHSGHYGVISAYQPPGAKSLFGAQVFLPPLKGRVLRPITAPWDQQPYLFCARATAVNQGQKCEDRSIRYQCSTPVPESQVALEQFAHAGQTVIVIYTLSAPKALHGGVCHVAPPEFFALLNNADTRGFLFRNSAFAFSTAFLLIVLPWAFSDFIRRSA